MRAIVRVRVNMHNTLLGLCPSLLEQLIINNTSFFRWNGEATVFTGICLPTPAGGWGIPHPAQQGVTPSCLLEGTSISEQGRGTPSQDKRGPQDRGVPSPSHCIGVSPPPGEGASQREYLLRGGRYVSCFHAGGLSCSVNL